jgi:hypothetical protein
MHKSSFLISPISWKKKMKIMSSISHPIFQKMKRIKKTEIKSNIIEFIFHNFLCCLFTSQIHDSYFFWYLDRVVELEIGFCLFCHELFSLLFHDEQIFNRVFSLIRGIFHFFGFLWDLNFFWVKFGWFEWYQITRIQSHNSSSKSNQKSHIIQSTVS